MPPRETHPTEAALARQAHALAAHSPHRLRRVFAILESVLVDGTEADGRVVATGFFEVLVTEYRHGFDLRTAWFHMGPESRLYCLAWNKALGNEPPEWMIA
ncbi:hypothetical protein [Actinokineospora enzanensis]|uniref:hypothetical protein n=1 Tax=Actinokineospora enzanensis TaxID=155975 RepID=UPI0003AAA584|nr:hypothetical protein [Actinokineospora enzanensis]